MTMLMMAMAMMTTTMMMIMMIMMVMIITMIIMIKLNVMVTVTIMTMMAMIQAEFVVPCFLKNVPRRPQEPSQNYMCNMGDLFYPRHLSFSCVFCMFGLAFGFPVLSRLDWFFHVDEISKN